jgi:tetratricopeptide (TPR) repeat protein
MGDLYSKSITISIREPTTEENEILDALWPNARFLSNIRDDKCWPQQRYSARALTRLVEKYPYQPLIKYIYFNLARTYLKHLGSKEGPATYGLAIPILKMLMNRYPEFRYEEVRFLLAFGYYHLGHREKAVEVFDKLLEEHNTLKDQPSIFTWKSVFDFEDFERGQEARAQVRPRRQSVWNRISQIHW